jgi:hypothetical protein
VPKNATRAIASIACFEERLGGVAAERHGAAVCFCRIATGASMRHADVVGAIGYEVEIDLQLTKPRSAWSLLNGAHSFWPPRSKRAQPKRKRIHGK